MKHDSTCIKCGEADKDKLQFTWRPRAEPQKLKNGLAINTIPSEEWMEITCRRCGFTWGATTLEQDIMTDSGKTIVRVET